MTPSTRPSRRMRRAARDPAAVLLLTVNWVVVEAMKRTETLATGRYPAARGPALRLCGGRRGRARRQHSSSFGIGALIESRCTWMPVRKLPVRCTRTHCTMGSLPIVVQATREGPVAPNGEYEVSELMRRIFTGPRRSRRGLDAL